MKKRIGILGGSFDPIHLGHIAMACAALEERDLDEVVFLPASQNPLKSNTPSASRTQRLKMLELGLVNYPKFSVDTREILDNSQAQHFTVDSLRAIRKERGDDCALFWIMGGDSLAGLHEWKDVLGMLSLLDGFVIFARNGERNGKKIEISQELRNKLSSQEIAKIQDGICTREIMQVSSSEIRRKIAEGKEWKCMLPDVVGERIVREGIYKLP
jgi:nicotinate-nucleotide adenylyltransferase